MNSSVGPLPLPLNQEVKGATLLEVQVRNKYTY